MLQGAFVLTAANLHAIRQKLQQIMGLAEGQNEVNICRVVRDIAGLLPHTVTKPLQMSGD